MAGVLPATLRARFARSNSLPANLLNLDSVPPPALRPNTKKRLPLTGEGADFFYLDLVGVRGFEPPSPASRRQLGVYK